MAPRSPPRQFVWCGAWKCCSSRFFLKRNPDAVVLLLAGKRLEHLSGTGAGHALAGLDQKQSAVGGALDQAAAAIEELVG